ncbi:MAG TPA: FumA C-terminus/TtdB family hydratase beta subunit [Kiritimatiellia bacterium]|nr:FumA C-terminus/TtdB family hydratase beta subunit [Kiritimatiellia bacterium]HPS08928.1 FumA C-terminus/TtdB family hydratase beta subunit [Kiritimatiellia bacterium]
MSELRYPFSEQAVRALRAGEIVRVSGRIFTGRDRLHKFLAEGGACPVSLRDGALFHCGPVVVPQEGGWRVVAAGPTTSVREEPYMAKVIEDFGVRVIIGKGGMGAATQAACARYGCVYLQAVGGAAALLAQRIRRVDGVHFLDTFGATEALWLLEVEAFEAVVGIDTHGRNLFDEVKAASRETLQRLCGGRA